MQDYTITPTTLADMGGILELYWATAAVEGGLARVRDEISEDYVRHNCACSLARGVSLVAKVQERVVGEIHAYRPGPRVFAHVLSDLTIAVHPQFQGRSIGRTLFTAFILDVTSKHRDIHRIELMARESNGRAISLYRSLGFRIEGRLEGRIRGADGQFEADLPMAWRRGAA